MRSRSRRAVLADPSRPPTDPHSRFPLSRPPPPARPGLQRGGLRCLRPPRPALLARLSLPLTPPSAGTSLPLLIQRRAATSACPAAGLPSASGPSSASGRGRGRAEGRAGGAVTRTRRGHGGLLRRSRRAAGKRNASMEAPPPPPPPGAPSASEPAGCPKDADRQLRLRLCVLNEILSTERDYVGTLHFLQSVSGDAGGGSPSGGRRGGLSAGGSGEQLVEVPAAGPIRAGGISCAERRRAGDARAVTGSDPGMRLLRGTPRPFCCCCEVVLLFVKSSAFVACYL